MDSVAGGWLGTYAYGPGSGRSPVRFEATFTAHGDGFTGRILDDGNLGEAEVRDGVQEGASVSFVKVYLRALASTAPVHYAGSLSEDGKALTGTWTLSVQGQTIRGVWEAHRTWWDVAGGVEREAEATTLAGVA